MLSRSTAPQRCSTSHEVLEVSIAVAVPLSFVCVCLCVCVMMVYVYGCLSASVLNVGDIQRSKGLSSGSGHSNHCVQWDDCRDGHYTSGNV
eukprot:m.101814 g.101814  ORF g.101814 m.101814 type:complete len:91 (-) comp16817_c0_seq9:1420-1692(-)